MSKTKIALAASAATLISTAAVSTAFADEHTASEKGECHGVNECKGTGACGTPGGHACAGQNACKAQGWLYISKAECEEKGGEYKKH